MHRTGVILALLAGAALGGCASSDHDPGMSARASRPLPRANANLVMTSPLMAELGIICGEAPDSGWEASRYDQPAGEINRIPDRRAYVGVEERYRERLRTSHGRPRENSSYETRIRRLHWK